MMLQQVHLSIVEDVLQFTNFQKATSPASGCRKQFDRAELFDATGAIAEAAALLTPEAYQSQIGG